MDSIPFLLISIFCFPDSGRILGKRPIGKVGLALAQMDVVTQQNAALAEESATAASLAKHAHSLNMLIAAFKVERATGIGPGGYRT